MLIDECRTPCRDGAPAPGTYDQSPIDPAKPAAYATFGFGRLPPCLVPRRSKQHGFSARVVLCPALPGAACIVAAMNSTAHVAIPPPLLIAEPHERMDVKVDFKLQHQETSGAWRVFLPEKAELDDRYPTGEAIRLREELSEQIRSLEEGKRLFVNLVPVLSP